MAERNQRIHAFRSLNRRDFCDGENIAFRQFFCTQRGDGFRLATHKTLRHGDAQLRRFVADINHHRAALGIQMRKFFHGTSSNKTETTAPAFGASAPASNCNSAFAPVKPVTAPELCQRNARATSSPFSIFTRAGQKVSRASGRKSKFSASGVFASGHEIFAPENFSNASLTATCSVTKCETGLPGRINAACLPRVAKTSGLPGRRLIFSK